MFLKVSLFVTSYTSNTQLVPRKKADNRFGVRREPSTGKKKKGSKEKQRKREEKERRRSQSTDGDGSKPLLPSRVPHLNLHFLSPHLQIPQFEVDADGGAHVEVELVVCEAEEQVALADLCQERESAAHTHTIHSPQNIAQKRTREKEMFSNGSRRLR
jgi:hypothetical protein